MCALWVVLGSASHCTEDGECARGKKCAEELGNQVLFLKRAVEASELTYS